jgi:hypothetical protein
VKPGHICQEGVVVAVTERGVLVGRRAEPGETLPPRHTLHVFDGVTVFLSQDQAPIPPAGLHPKKAKKGKK